MLGGCLWFDQWDLSNVECYILTPFVRFVPKCLLSWNNGVLLLSAEKEHCLNGMNLSHHDLY